MSSKKTNTVALFRIFSAVEDLLSSINELTQPKEFKSLADFFAFKIAQRPGELNRQLLEEMYQNIIRRIEEFK